MSWEEKSTGALRRDTPDQHELMDLVIDANILFAALIKDSFTAELLLDEGIGLFAPEYLLEEFYEHREEILEKTKRIRQGFDSMFRDIKSLITVVPERELEEFMDRAREISPDPDDAPYFALALKLGCAVWSNEKALQQQKIIKIYTTEELSRLR